MPSAAVYLGLEPTRTQDVNPVLRDRGIELIRCEPARIKPIITLQRRVPQHSIYKDFFPLFATKAYNPVSWATTADSLWTGLPSTALIPSLLKSFNVVFDFTHPINESKMDEIRASIPSVEQSSPRGKAVFIIPNVTITHLVYVKEAMRLGASPITRCHAGTINLSALQTMLLLVRTANVFLRVNQYPIFGTDDDVDSEMFADVITNSVTFDQAQLTPLTTFDRGDGQEITAIRMPILEHRTTIHCNLATPPDNFNYVISTQADLAGALEGIIVPYVPELSLPDANTVPSTIRQYFMGFLSTDDDNVRKNFQKVLGDWGILFNTPNGQILSHLYWCINFTFQTQTTMRLAIQSSYCGVVIYGGGYTAQIGDRIIEGNSARNLAAAYRIVSPHSAALESIFGNMSFANENDRVAGRNMCTTMQGLKAFLATRQLSEDQRSTILQHSKFLTFHPDPAPSLPNAHNVSLALRLIADTAGRIDHLHLPFAKIFENDRNSLIWSQFGTTAPSFKIPGGKTQDISRKMQHRTRKDQNNPSSTLETVNTGKMGMILVPLDRAIADLDELLSTKTIHNPFASQIMARVSAKSMIKAIEGQSFSDVVSALRAALQVAEPMDEDESNGGSSKKRRAEASDDEEEKKRMRGFEF